MNELHRLLYIFKAELFVPNEGFTYVRISAETAKNVKSNYFVRYLPVKHGEATMSRSLRCFSRFSLFKVTFFSESVDFFS